MRVGPMNPGVGVVVATYNRPAALSWVLAGLFHQSSPPAVICVADDGSGPETRSLVEQWQAFYAQHSGTRLDHVWQPDEGFQLAKIRNLAARKLQESPLVDRVIFLDGDCVPRQSFVASHQALLGAQADRLCVAGGRVLMDRSLTEVMEEQAPLNPSLASKQDSKSRIDRLWLKFFSGQLDRLLPLTPLPDGSWRLRRASDYRVLRGCNFSMYLSDYLNIGGCSEEFQGWGLEDSDLAIRLIASGVRLKSGRCATNVYHLWHPEADRSKLPEHQARLSALLHQHGLAH